MFGDIETAIVEQLKSKLDRSTYVLTSRELSEIDEERQPTPAVHVIYNGYRVIESRADGSAARIEQNWLAVIAVRNQRQPGSGSAARTDAVNLLTPTANALMGFKPDVASKPLRLTNAPAAGNARGFMYVPLAFSVETILKQTN
ncbi:phage tail terminator protein [Gynuella sp.]|uniref:phage tail terminator protein n=1 Tax=Gynuella sp. TaxID=2969146 RepID=UPI003D0EADE6